MNEIKWTVRLVNQAKKALKDLPQKTRESFVALLNEMEELGPINLSLEFFRPLDLRESSCGWKITTGLILII